MAINGPQYARLPFRIPVVALVAAALATAQQASAEARLQGPVFDVDSSLAMLSSGDPDRLNSASIRIMRAFQMDHAAYSNADRQRLLDGMERVALGEAGTGELARTRALRVAFSMLRVIALDTFPTGEDAGIALRVLRIYEQSPRARGLAVSLLADFLAHYPQYQSEIEALLFTAASTPQVPGVAPQTVIDALTRAGDPGIALLRRLHDENAVRDGNAAMYLRELARRGYPRQGPPGPGRGGS
jgi:hypothetical protein